jgi:hypothetical protein
MSPLTEPTTLFAIGPERAAYLLMIAVWIGSLATSRVTTSFVAVTLSIVPSAGSIVRSTRVIIRPNDAALVTYRPEIMQL